MSLREHFLAFDDTLAKAGVPPLTAWWRDRVGPFLDRYEADGVLELVACAGRGSAKSTVLYKLTLFFGLLGGFEVPPGERHYAIVLSRLKEEASKGVAIIARWLTLLGIAHRPAGDVIELEGQPRGIRVVAASVAATSGWRAFFVGKDERSKWPQDGVEGLDAGEIDTSATAMTATHPNAPAVTVGSAWGDFGEFYEAVTAGSDAFREVLGPVPTWVAAPHISEESTRRKERNEKRWKREYACVFQAGAGSAFDAEQVEQAMGREVPGIYRKCTRILVLDPTAGASDTYAFGVVGWRRPHERIPGTPLLEFSYLNGIENASRKGWTSDRMVGEIARIARANGCSVIHSDQFERFSLASAFANKGFRFISHAWTAPLKERAVEHVRTWLADGVLALPKHDRMKKELLSFEEKIAPSGALTFRGRAGGHDDFAMLLVLAALVDVEEGLPGSPLFDARARAQARRVERNAQILEALNGSTELRDKLRDRRNEEGREYRATDAYRAKVEADRKRNLEIWSERLAKGDPTTGL